MKTTDIQIKVLLLLLLMAVVMLTSCAESEAAADGGGSVVARSAELTFDAYTSRATSAQTRAGFNGSIGDAQLRMPATLGGGFGVFASHTDSRRFDEQSPMNLMYNQLVTYNSAYQKWQYTPVKYWPNEYGTSAQSGYCDKVSFFAYAPFVGVTPSTGTALDGHAYGITALSGNGMTGAPSVHYVSTFDADKTVDLCWGVCQQPSWPVVEGGSAQAINKGLAGLPWLDVERPAQTVQDLKFQFRHATAQLSVSIDTFADTYDTPASVGNTDETRIYVRSVTFTGLATRGVLSLNNTDPDQPLWLGEKEDCLLQTGDELTVYDGRQDGREGFLMSDASAVEPIQGLNPDIIQSAPWGDDAQTPGVDGTERGLFRRWDSSVAKYVAAGARDAICVIPTGDDFSITICYDIETVSPALATYLADGVTHGTSIENCITKTVTFGRESALQAGHRYELRLHLGLNSVKFDAAVGDWLDEPVSEVEMPKPVIIGNLYFSDGTWGTREQYPDKKPIGVVFSDKVSDADREAGYTHGYVVALRSTDVDRKGYEDSGRWGTLNIQLGSSTNTEEEALADLDGRLHSQEIYSLLGQTVSGTLVNSSVISAVNNAMTNYNSSTNGDDAPASSSGWYLPSLGQLKLVSDNWQDILAGSSGLSDSGGASKPDFTGWRNFTFSKSYMQVWLTSSEEGAGNAWRMKITNKVTGETEALTTQKSSGSACIRPVLAF